jgi:hypothetical protein
MSTDALDRKLPDRNLDIKTNGIKFGIIGGLVGILVSVTLFIANLQFESWARWISTLVLFGAVIAGIKTIAQVNQGKIISFGALFKGGMLITLIIAVISIAYFFIYLNFIETDFTGKVLDISRTQMAEKGLGEEQIEKAINISRKFVSPGIMALFALTGTFFFGAIASLIGAAIYKNEK